MGRLRGLSIHLLMMGALIELALGPYESTVVVFSQKGAKLRAAVATLLSRR